ncbi:HGxxPAAW family protein [Streptomyces sp. SBT349]|uniref:HGxxPAAW family protein n=1 Tax=Streptomyces sp. SBT349 TaxID=1580539 RepID=UPI0007C86124|nr:HGxxPAAW family protein [Streptomyces sp. SBT349]
MAREYHHGNTPAAWTAVTIIFIGFGIGSAYTVTAQPWGVAAGAVVVALGGVVGLVMRAMGLGQPTGHAPAAPVVTVPAPASGEDRERAATS